MTSLYDFSMPDLQGATISFSGFKNKVLLIVNTASKCGFTPQYEGLEKLYEKYRTQGFEILGFPCNQFGQQEKGSNDEIASFCQLNYGVTFPMFSKIEVNGDGAAPLYKHLKKQAPGIMGSKAIKWNFTKFLVGRDGRVVRRYAPTDKPESLEKDIEALL